MKLTWTLVENPIADADTPLIADLSRHQLTSASFRTSAQGGFADGQIGFGEVSERFIVNALDHWLARGVVATDGGGISAYEGYVAEIHATLNNQRIVRSIDTFANRVFLEYRYGGGACPKGQLCKGRAVAYESDISSSSTVTEWGIKEEWLDYSGKGALTSALATEAAQIRLRRTLRAKDYTHTLGATEKTSNNLSLVLWGYYTTTQWRKTNVPVRTATDVGTIVAHSISPTTYGNKAPLLSTDHSQVGTIGVTRKWSTDSRPVWLMDYIQGVIAEGDADGREIQFQVWDNRMPFLVSRSNQPRYFIRHDDPRVWDANRRLVPLYLVRAGGFAVSENTPESVNPFSDILQRPRATFIEHTEYDDITETLTIPNGQQVISPERLLARARRILRRKSVD